MVKEIIIDEEELSERCDEIDIRKENNLMREIIINLKETIRANKNAVGLSANQIGYNKRIFCINFKGDIRTFINPITTEAKGLTLSREGCLSLPGREFIRPRNNNIAVLYQTPLGKTESKRFLGFAASVFQHELDHLDGLLLSDIGMEIFEDYDKATEDERAELLKQYMDSLDIKQKELQEEIDNDEELQKLDEGIKFMEAYQRGEVTIEKIEKKDNSGKDKEEDVDNSNKEE